MSSQQVMYHMYVSFQDDDKISIFTMDPATQIPIRPGKSCARYVSASLQVGRSS